ncbi:hypothetical protein [Flavonifractor sp. An306]|uniref:hypothetical protein n=1 Tax=Flavonifractor sp. An306 TaxID=1965629 RepID=UPI001749C598|nr:hypothetical protein [Flavonifractor sp. An306]
MEQQLQAVIEGLASQHTKFLIAYVIVFLAIVLNSIFIKIHTKNQKYMNAVALFAENILLCIALLLFSIIHVLIVDAVGQEFYHNYGIITNICLVVFFIGLFLCFIDLFIVISCYLRRKKC